MVRAKLYVGLVILIFAALVAGACGSESSTTPDLEVRDAADARDAGLTYLREHEAQNAPSAGIEWQEQDITPPGLVGAVTKQFSSDEWTIRVSYAVVPLERTVYQVVVSSIILGWHWKGDVKADGSVAEVSAFMQMSEEESQTIAEEVMRSSPTFVFDGIEDTLRLTDTLTARCPYCWVFIFEFDSRHAGYGDRTGQSLAQVITPHRAVIAVEQSEVISAIMDDKWNMITQQMIEEPEGALSVSELSDNPVYDTQVMIYGEVALLGELFCPCFELTSGGATLQIWYDLMVEDSGIERAPVSVEGIENGDWVIVTGELRPSDGQLPSTTFWASNIEKTIEVLAPIESVEILILESFPPQYNLAVVSGLPNSCVSFGYYNMARDGDTIRVEVTNLEPAEPDVACAEIYRTVQTVISLGSEFESGKTYTVIVNNMTETFVAQ
jgi:hypothetical protein